MTIIRRVVLTVLIVVVAGCHTAAEDPDDEPMLRGTSWVATSVGPGAPTVGFTQEGQVRGDAGCNSYFGSYDLEGTQLVVGELATTKKLCQPPEVMEREAAFLAALREVKTVRIESGELVMEGADGEPLLRLIPAEE